MTDATVSPSKKYRIPIYRVALVRDGSQKADDKQIRGSWMAAHIFREFLGDVDREHFCVMMLNTKLHVIGIHTVSIGSLDATLAMPREVFKPAILSNAASVILCHNHPSGDTTPSGDDISLTGRLAEAGSMLGIRVHDHVIIGDDNKYYAFSESSPTTLQTEGSRTYAATL
jgi:DNA repair protein RadC